MTSLLDINFTEAGLVINSTLVSFPLDVEVLKNIFGPPRVCSFKTEKSKISFGSQVASSAPRRCVYIWDDLGICANSKTGAVAETFSIQLARKHDSELIPTSDANANGKIQISGQMYQELALTKNLAGDSFEVPVGAGTSYFSLCDRKIESIEFSQPAPKEMPMQKLDVQKYTFKSIEGEKLVFNDFNFKLCVIQILMYEQKLLEPKFNLREFIKLQDRKIDIDEEGYELIPEVKAYFEQLEIPQALAPNVTEIYLNGGDEIYGNIIPFWDGEDDTFAIESFIDIGQFKNVTEVTAYFDHGKESQIEELRNRGIVVNAL